MDSNVTDNEPLTRFLIPQKHYSSSKREIKAAAFFPPYRKPEISVYRIHELLDYAVWSIGDDYVAPHFPKANGRFSARADLFTSAVRKQRLNVVPDTEPHERHANIVGWINAPENPDDQEQRESVRGLWMSLCNELILDARLVERE